MSTFEPVVVLMTTPDPACAEAIADRLLALKLCACVNVVPAVNSQFFWQGAFQTAAESLCIVKTGRHLLPQLEQAVRSMHPYQVPEIIALPVIWGNADFVAWVESTVS
jgi:periplasmic divalent cation tolerance protein